jgi:hypothetical protein
MLLSTMKDGRDHRLTRTNMTTKNTRCLSQPPSQQTRQPSTRTVWPSPGFYGRARLLALVFNHSISNEQPWEAG